MARVLPLLVLLLLGLAVAFKPKTRSPGHVQDSDLPPAARKRVIAIRKELRTLLTESCKRFLFITKEIVWARRCIFQGLPIDEYLKLKAICKNRSESLDALREYRMRCNHDNSKCDEAEFNRLFHERQKAVAACGKIGWDGDGKDCPNLRELEAGLEETKDACRGKIDRIRELRKKIRDVKANFVRPSVAPVVRIDI